MNLYFLILHLIRASTTLEELLLNPLDRFLSKGTEIAIIVYGSRSNPKLSIDLQKTTFGRQDPTPHLPNSPIPSILNETTPARSAKVNQRA